MITHKVKGTLFRNKVKLMCAHLRGVSRGRVRRTSAQESKKVIFFS